MKVGLYFLSDEKKKSKVEYIIIKEWKKETKYTCIGSRICTLKYGLSLVGSVSAFLNLCL